MPARARELTWADVNIGHSEERAIPRTRTPEGRRLRKAAFERLGLETREYRCVDNRSALSVGEGGRLGPGTLDRVKYALSWYLSRRAVLAAIAPTHFTVQLPDGIQAPDAIADALRQVLAEVRMLH